MLEYPLSPSGTLANPVRWYPKSDHCFPPPLGHSGLSSSSLTSPLSLKVLPHIAAKTGFLKLNSNTITLLLKFLQWFHCTNVKIQTISEPTRSFTIWSLPTSLTCLLGLCLQTHCLTFPPQMSQTLSCSGIWICCGSHWNAFTPGNCTPVISSFSSLLRCHLLEEHQKHLHALKSYYSLPLTMFSFLCRFVTIWNHLSFFVNVYHLSSFQ